MMILTKEGFIYKSVPNMEMERDDKGNWNKVQNGLKIDGIPLMKVVMFEDNRSNPALEVLLSTGMLINQGESK